MDYAEGKEREMDRNHLTRPSRQQDKIMGHHKRLEVGGKGKSSRKKRKQQSRTGIRERGGANSRSETILSLSIQGTTYLRGIHHVHSHLGLQLE